MTIQTWDTDSKHTNCTGIQTRQAKIQIPIVIPVWSSVNDINLLLYSSISSRSWSCCLLLLCCHQEIISHFASSRKTTGQCLLIHQHFNCNISHNQQLPHALASMRQIKINAGFRLACRLAAMPRDHRLLFQSCSSQRQRRFGFSPSGKRSRVE